MTKSEKIVLINTLHSKVIDWDCSGYQCNRVTIQLDDEALNVLNQLGVDDQYIQVNQEEGDNGALELDIENIGFQNCEAAWWDDKIGFLEVAPV